MLLISDKRFLQNYTVISELSPSSLVPQKNIFFVKSRRSFDVIYYLQKKLVGFGGSKFDLALKITMLFQQKHLIHFKTS